MADLGIFVRLSGSLSGFRSRVEDPLLEHFHKGNGYRAWIRTMNNASKGRYYSAKKEKERSPGAREELILPGHHVEVTQCARNCFPVLAKTRRYFMRERTVFELGTISKDGARLVQVEPDGFCSQLENYFILCSFLKVRDKLELVRRCCSTSDAIKLLKCDAARELLPPIKLVTAAPVFVEQGGKLEILSKGYHQILGGIYVTRASSLNCAISSCRSSRIRRFIMIRRALTTITAIGLPFVREIASIGASQPANAELISFIKVVRSARAKPRWRSLRPPLLSEPDGPRFGRCAEVCFWNVS
jgi:hypothetical protein